MVNPASEESLEEVVKHVRSLSLQDGRKWTILHSDGIPYVQLTQMQDNIYKCSECDIELDRRGHMPEDKTNTAWLEAWTNAQQDHLHTHKSTTSQFLLKFGDILIMPGPGHIIFNMGRKLLDILWEPILSHFAAVLGFRSKNAQNVVRKGVDHHRTKQILSTCLFATAKELVRPYILQCHSLGQEVDASGYEAWIAECVMDQNYILLHHMTFTYLLTLNAYTEATRKNDGQLMLGMFFL